MKRNLNNAFDTLEFSKDFEENTIQKITENIADRKDSQSAKNKFFHCPAKTVVKIAITFGAVFIIGTGAYAAGKSLLQHIWGSNAKIVEPYADNEKYSKETSHYQFTVENIFLSESNAQYILHVKAKKEEAKKELDISKVKKALENDEDGIYEFTKYSCTFLDFNMNLGQTEEMIGISQTRRLLTELSETGSWYILNTSQKSNTANYYGIKISAWAKWKGTPEQVEFDIPAKKIQKSIPVPAVCAYSEIKDCLVNSNGITAKTADSNSTEIATFFNSGAIFKVTMKDGSEKIYDGVFVYNDKNFATFSCMFDEPLATENIKMVEIAAR